ncbi:MAG: thiamine pyrophosphate-dependent dehydrogenase E1 component subunit alpha [Peptococcaceae bacterium]|nr:thiamine pyrophosphate-dependent dehydrogenase E1 component subunit alpha [Peptococcaceae bacterium]MDH7524990.1 thiamine pyrophosphate-dependent dehydrogenase E1 component subunit alpha [Peptococcaceae bacterium]
MKTGGYDRETAVKFYREMLRIRLFEMKAAELFSRALLAGNIHTCVGQEAVAVGACQALRPGDYITATHRGHGHCLAKGGDSRKMMAELFGKSAGYCRGKGGSMHIADVSLGILGANGIVGAGLPIAAGSALASKIMGKDEVTLAFFGDGASNTGNFHESLNMASAWNLPVIYLCENNRYGVSVCIERVTRVSNLAERAKAYGIPGVTIDGNDVFAVHEAVAEAARRARGGEGPTLIEAVTYRHRGHYEGDPQVYKPKEEIQEWKERDPVAGLKRKILEEGLAGDEELGAIENELRLEIEEAVEFAMDSPYPDAAQVTADVYSKDNEWGVAR